MEVLLIALLTLLNGVFAMSEMALASSRKARLAAMAEAGDNGAAAALRLMEQPTRFLSTVQVGITSIGVLNGIVGEAAFSESLAHWMQGLGMGVRPSGYAATAIDTAVAAIHTLALDAHDTFYDLGAGLGLPTCVAALSSEAACIGIEYHAHYAARATATARRLGIAARFEHADATTADLSAGTAFFLFNPFTADVLPRVLDRLLAIAHPIRIACVHLDLPPPFVCVSSAGVLRIYAPSRDHRPSRARSSSISD